MPPKPDNDRTENVVTIDARGHRCPVPTLRLRRALETQASVTLLADDPMAQIDVPHFCTQNAFGCDGPQAHDRYWSFRVWRESKPADL